MCSFFLVKEVGKCSILIGCIVFLNEIKVLLGREKDIGVFTEVGSRSSRCVFFFDYLEIVYMD